MLQWRPSSVSVIDLKFYRLIIYINGGVEQKVELSEVVTQYGGTYATDLDTDITTHLIAEVSTSFFNVIDNLSRF